MACVFGRFQANLLFRPGRIFGYVRWQANEYGTQDWRFAIVQTHEPSDLLSRIEGVKPGHDPGQLYDAAHDVADGKEFLERSESDRHQFRFIVSPEDAVELGDLKPFVRDLMRGMDDDLGTRLDWVAVDHFNTQNPHSHIVLRGKDEGADFRRQ